MTIPFLLIRSGVPVRECVAPDKQTAVGLLAPMAGEYVISRASWAVPVPKAVKACQGGVRACRCGSVKGMAPWSDYCQACRTEHQRKARIPKPPMEPLLPAVVREGRARLERQMADAAGGKPGRPRKTPAAQRAAAKYEAKPERKAVRRDRDRTPERRAYKAQWERAKRANG